MDLGAADAGLLPFRCVTGRDRRAADRTVVELPAFRERHFDAPTVLLCAARARHVVQHLRAGLDRPQGVEHVLLALDGRSGNPVRCRGLGLRGPDPPPAVDPLEPDVDAALPRGKFPGESGADPGLFVGGAPYEIEV